MLEPLFWNWLILFGICLIMELFTGSFFFVFQAVAALIVVGLSFFCSGLVQVFLFAVLSLIAIAIWWKFWTEQGRKKTSSDVADKLNNRAENLIGKKIVLREKIENGYGKEQIDDSLWTLHDKEGKNIAAGVLVQIIGVKSMELEIAICE
ncbi:MAG: NfeD family protein [Cardiobacteriaceae bacterium]|nr:NfeD family protein [Cardiobacteriaceae bacterium]